MVDERLARAIEENVAWCNRVVRAHGRSTQGDGSRWWAAARTPDLYPDVITRSPDLIEPDAVLAGVDVGPGCSVKDSFAVLDLSAAGFDVLFEASWVDRPPVADGVDVRDREVVDDVLRPLVGDPAVRFAVSGTTTFVLHDPGMVVGVSNIAGDPLTAWRSCPDRVVVGYESGDALAAAERAGATVLGPLRVWLRAG